jgi:hypothetical protein
VSFAFSVGNCNTVYAKEVEIFQAENISSEEIKGVNN